MRVPNNTRLSHFKSVYLESIKTILLHTTSGASVWVKTIEERSKNGSYESSYVPRAVATLEASKYNNDAGLLLHKRKDGGAQWIYRYTIHGRRHEMGLGALRDVSLKQARELATGWRSI